MPELARLLDPAELDASSGPHGRMTIDLSSAALGESVAILVPKRLVCARCDGGGCDACGRSGGIRIDLAASERNTNLVVPTDASERLLVRLVRPLGDAAGLDQLTIEVRISQGAPTPASNSPGFWSVMIIVVVLLTALVLAALIRG